MRAFGDRGENKVCRVKRAHTHVRSRLAAKPTDVAKKNKKQAGCKNKRKGEELVNRATKTQSLHTNVAAVC